MVAFHDVFRYAWDLGYRQVELETNNLEVSKIWYQLSDALAGNGFVCAVNELRNREWVVELRHIHRTQNAVADALAGWSRGSSPGVLEFGHPPSELEMLLQEDLLGTS
ncbi:uncharacterized protein LOC120192830 [Hibiscus syriacus]|uniref:uncharacterized protein LOC120192830 n=1 Tax=Hibiscus syriacus TaxID=106335 RepID=UPI0019205BEB|nr:uncharacterized protein LOC120192830 [Hibiscus syriacus]